VVGRGKAAAQQELAGGCWLLQLAAPCNKLGASKQEGQNLVFHSQERGGNNSVS